MTQPVASSAASMGSLLGQGAVRAALDAFNRHTPKALSHFTDLVIKNGKGSWVWTMDGSKYLDMTSGIGVTSTGHCHPRVVEAVRAQAGEIVHAQQNVFGAHVPVMQLIDRLLEITPSYLNRFFFCNSGAEAVDNAIKVARVATGRQNIIAFEGGYHGRTIGSMAITTSKNMYRQGFAPLMPGAFTAPYPYCLHCKVKELQGHAGYHVAPYCSPFDSPANRTCCNSPLESLKWMLKMQTAPSETAAIILEPVMGEGGFLSPPPGFMRELRKIADQHGILIISDEVQAGMARTGTWWGFEQFDDGAMKPDILIFAKGIASGYPLAGLATKEHLFDKLVPGSIGGTYGANAVVCAAAVATIDVIRDEGILENASARGVQLMKGLVDIASRHPSIIDVRGRGLMVGIEFGALDGSSRTAVTHFASSVTRAASKRHMLLMGAGARESIRFLPALTVSGAEIDQALNIFEAALTDATVAAQSK